MFFCFYLLSPPVEFSSASVFSVWFTLDTCISWKMSTATFLGDQSSCDYQPTNQQIPKPSAFNHRFGGLDWGETLLRWFMAQGSTVACKFPVPIPALKYRQHTTSRLITLKYTLPARTCHSFFVTAVLSCLRNAVGLRKFHDGLGFLTSHALITNTFEYSLQRVNPKLTVPYWDFTIETSSSFVKSAKDSTEPQASSPLFDPAWFGTSDHDDNMVSAFTLRWEEVNGAERGGGGGEGL